VFDRSREEGGKDELFNGYKVPTAQDENFQRAVIQQGLYNCTTTIL
jgi:hypothetical protein